MKRGRDAGPGGWGEGEGEGPRGGGGFGEGGSGEWRRGPSLPSLQLSFRLGQESPSFAVIRTQQREFSHRDRGILSSFSFFPIGISEKLAGLLGVTCRQSEIVCFFLLLQRPTATTSAPKPCLLTLPRHKASQSLHWPWSRHCHFTGLGFGLSRFVESRYDF